MRRPKPALDKHLRSDQIKPGCPTGGPAFSLGVRLGLHRSKTDCINTGHWAVFPAAKGLKMMSRLALNSLILSLALPATVQAALPAPTVQDGDLGCVIATGHFTVLAKKAAEKPGITAQEREKAATIYDKALISYNFFMGRLSMLSGDQTSGTFYKAAAGRFLALDEDARAKMIHACLEFASNSKQSLIKAREK